MVLSSRRKFLMGLIIPFTMTACSKGPASEQVVQQFMEDYYVKMDLKGAEALSMGLAKEKLDREIQLVGGQTLGSSAHVPTVDIALKSKDFESAEEASYIYRVIPKVHDVGERMVYVKLRHEGGQWKVSQFLENYPGAPLP